MKYDKQYEELAELGVFDCNTRADVQVVRKIYRSQQKAAWRNRNRKNNKSITITVTKDEFSRLTKASTTYNTNRTRFVYAAAMAQANGAPFIPNDDEFRKLREALWVNMNYICGLEETNAITPQATAEMIKRLETIEREMTNRFYKPELLVEVIKVQIEGSPQFKSILQTLITT